MKKLFGHKQKSGKPNSISRDFNEADIPKPTTIPTPVYQKLATHGNHISQQQLSIQQQQQQQQSQPPQPPQPQPQPQPPQSATIEGDGWEVLATHPNPDQSQLLSNPYPIPLLVPPSRSSSYTQLPNISSQPIQNVSMSQPQSSIPINQSPPMQVTNAPPPKGKLVRHHDPARDAYAQAQANGRSKPPSERHHPPSLHPAQPHQPTAPVAMSILRSLEPPKAALAPDPIRPQSDYGGSESGHTYRDREEKRERRGFWGGAKDKDRDRDRAKERPRERPPQDRIQYEQEHRNSDYRREDDSSPAELMRMIGYLTATASEDWELVMKVCERASANENNAKEAVRALRREFKYGEAPAQLSAARLWAIMLRNSTDVFILQSTSRKFLDTVEELLLSPKTAPVVRERLLDVVGAAAYASGHKKDSKHDKEGFKGLWKRVKPFDKPDEGVPIDTDDAMFNPPVSGRLSAYEMPMGTFPDPNVYPNESAPPTPAQNALKKRRSPSNRIIPPDEDMRRLFQECKIGQGNANVLSESLAAVKLEDFRKNSVIREFYSKCRSSQELIFAQIPWATANADRSRRERDMAPNDVSPNKRNEDLDQLIQGIMDFPMELTVEEKLLAALLSVNGELLEALKQYDDLLRVAHERKAEERSRRERSQKIPIRDETNLQSQQAHYRAPSFVSQASSRTPSPGSRASSPALSYHRPSHQQHHDNEPETPIANIHNASAQAALNSAHTGPNAAANPNANLMPPPPAPHGPRSPAAGLAAAVSLGSVVGVRTPSPGTTKAEGQTHGHGHSHSMSGGQGSITNGLPNSSPAGQPRIGTDDEDDIYSIKASADDGLEQHVKPSDKALGKRKVVDTDTLPSSPSNADSPNSPYDSRRDSVRSFDPEFDDDIDTRWRPKPQVNFVYDAVAERRRQHLEAMHDMKANAVH